MKKLSDKVVCIICTIAMCITCTFSYSWKIANKTYADTVPTTKQELGMWLSSILASVGARLYITTAQGYEWLADNFDAVMDSIGSAIYLVDLVQDAQNRYDQANSKVILSEESSKALTGFLQSLVNEGFSEDSTDFEVGVYENETQGTYVLVNASTSYPIMSWVESGNTLYKISKTSQDVRTVGYTNNSNPVLSIYFVSKNSFFYKSENNINPSYDVSRPTSSAGSATYNGETYYWIMDTLTWYSNMSNLISYVPTFDYISNSTDRRNDAFEKTFGLSSAGDGVEEVQVYGDGTLGLDDMIDTYDRNKEAEIDYSDFLGEDAGAKTLAEIMALIQEAINSGNTELVDAIPQAEVIIKTPVIIPENVDIPLLFQGLPEVIEPECVTLGGCLVSGVQTVSQHLQNVYSSHSAISNFTAVSLALGVAIYIITGGL